MYWNEDDPTDAPRQAQDSLDLLFEIDCKRIPVDHAYLLSQAIAVLVPWIRDEPLVGIHSIHVAGSQNGWERPEHGIDSLLMVSRRTKLIIRTPRARAEELLATLPGARLDIGGHALTLGSGKPRPLSTETTIFARYLAAGAPGAPELSEDAFLASAARALTEMDIRIRKALCGKSLPLQGPDGRIQTRSLMLSGLAKEEAVRLQTLGLGPYRLMGCGIFIPHKGIDPVGKTS